MTKKLVSTFVLALLGAAALSAQDVKTFFQQLPSAKTLPSFDQLLAAVSWQILVSLRKHGSVLIG